MWGVADARAFEYDDQPVKRGPFWPFRHPAVCAAIRRDRANPRTFNASRFITVLRLTIGLPSYDEASSSAALTLERRQILAEGRRCARNARRAAAREARP